MTPGQLRRRRWAVQLLDRAGRRDDPVPLVRGLLAVQAQDFPAARLALRARGAGSAGAVHQALDAGALRIGWLCRGTLHLVTAEDYPWLFALSAPRGAVANQRRLRQEGVSPAQADQALQLIGDALAAEGPLTRAELGDRLRAADLPTSGQALPHLLYFVALNHVLALGAIRSGAPAFVRLQPARTPAREVALAELARRYLAAHGPATEADLAAWSGLPLGDVRAGLDNAGAGTDRGFRVAPDAQGAAAAPTEAGQPSTPPDVRLLPAFDPWLLGWTERDFLIDDSHRRAVYPGGGIIRATVTWDRRAAGTWGLRRTAKGLRLTCALFGPGVPQDALRAEAEDVARFEGLPLDRLDVTTG